MVAISHKTCSIYKYLSIGSDVGFSPGRRQANIWTNDGNFTDANIRYSVPMSSHRDTI